ncbi:Imm30 family immunity protein [Aphanizomenon sp. CS-733/32]|uniref:Imm30 family immunity protein n=1 Tax=Aphanizomenon sp. CS-733/32 TaxID=3021715 RepID=UPI003FA437E3
MEIADNSDENNLPAYHLVLDDQCQQPEVMFSLIHFLESFDMENVNPYSALHNVVSIFSRIIPNKG